MNIPDTDPSMGGQLLRDKVALITGAASAAGIGFAAARRMSCHGAAVVLTDTGANSEALQDRAAEIRAVGGQALAVVLDVTDKAQVEAAVEATLKNYGQLDSVFNNAGYPGGCGHFQDLSDDQFESSWQINVMGIVKVCRAVIPALQQAGGGTIINNASLAGLGVIPKMSAYSASKFAVVGLTKCLAAEFGKDNIRVNALCPGMVWTDMGRAELDLLRRPGQTFELAKSEAAADVALGKRWAEADEIGDAVVYLSSYLSSYVSGVALPVAGGLAPGL